MSQDKSHFFALVKSFGLGSLDKWVLKVGKLIKY